MTKAAGASYSASVQRGNDNVEGRFAVAAAQFGFELDAQATERLRQLLGLWTRFGRAFNLSGATHEAGLFEHVLEGLQVVNLARAVGCHSGQAWLDVGSGAGFPGLVVAACLEVHVTFVEPRERRASFLDLAVNQIGRGDCRVIRGHIEGASWRPLNATAGPLTPRSFDWASARAVFAPEVWIGVGREWVKPGGTVVAHVRPESAVFAEEIARVDGERWSIRGVRG